MTIWGEVFLGIIAAATLVMAIGLVGFVVVTTRLIKRLISITEVFEREMTPLFAHLNAMARDASRAAALATAQVERADRLFADVVMRVETSLNAFQDAIAAPLRQGPAFLGALRTVFNILRDFRSGRRRSRSDDEDALFI